MFKKILGSSSKDDKKRRSLGFSHKSKTSQDIQKENDQNILMMNLFKQNIAYFTKPSKPLMECPSIVGFKTMNKTMITKKDLVFAFCDENIFEGSIKIDCWSSLKMPIDKYKPGNPTLSLVPPEIEKDGYSIEINASSVDRVTDLHQMVIVDNDTEFPYYKQFFYRNPGVKHYLSKEDLVVVSIQKFKESSRCILRDKKGVVRCLIGKEEGDKPEKYDKFFKDSKNVICLENFPHIDDSLLNMETKQLITHYKIGVIYVKPNQTDENAIFRNQPNECSPAFWKFMDLIGSKIELNGWEGYRGGLDVKTGTTGTHSYISRANGFDLMFHVAPLLPLLKDDEQGLERKRHVGNDVVVLIFKEQADENDLFDPRILTSHFNSIYIVVTPENTSSFNYRYKICLAAKSEINPFPPYIEDDSWNFHDDNFKDLVLRKCINGERQAMFSPTFRLNYRRTIQILLKDILDAYYK